MILDALLQLSNAQAVAAAANSTNTIDLGNVTPKRRIGAGESVSLVVIVTTTAVVAANTFDFSAVQSDNADLSAQDVIITRRVLGAALVVGGVFEIPLPSDTPTKRYLGARYAVGAGDSVSVSCFLVGHDEVPAFMAYAKNYVV